MIRHYRNNHDLDVMNQESWNGKVMLHWNTFFTNPYTWSVILLALVSVLYISAMFLSYYAQRAGDEVAFGVVRGYALGWSNRRSVLFIRARPSR